MNQPNLTDWISAWGSILGAIAAIAGLSYAGTQLKALVRQAKREAFTAFLALESEIIDKKQQVAEAARDLERLTIEGRPSEEIAIAGRYLESCIENWLNILDRFSACLRRKIFNEKHYKDDYCQYIAAIVRDHPERFGANSIYNNVIFICKRWKIKLPPLE